MPHQCVRCSKFYDDGDSAVLKGCTCGGKLFFYVRKEKLEKAKEVSVNLSSDEKVQIEKDVKDIIGTKKDDDTVILDFESISIVGPGKFEIDLVKLFDKDNALVYKLEDGKYMIDVASTLENFRKNKINKK